MKITRRNNTECLVNLQSPAAYIFPADKLSSWDKSRDIPVYNSHNPSTESEKHLKFIIYFLNCKHCFSVAATASLINDRETDDIRSWQTEFSLGTGAKVLDGEMWRRPFHHFIFSDCRFRFIFCRLQHEKMLPTWVSFSNSIYRLGRDSFLF